MFGMLVFCPTCPLYALICLSPLVTVALLQLASHEIQFLNIYCVKQTKHVLKLPKNVPNLTFSVLFSTETCARFYVTKFRN